MPHEEEGRMNATVKYSEYLVTVLPDAMAHISPNLSAQIPHFGQNFPISKSFALIEFLVEL